MGTCRPARRLICGLRLTRFLDAARLSLSGSRHRRHWTLHSRDLRDLAGCPCSRRGRSRLPRRSGSVALRSRGGRVFALAVMLGRLLLSRDQRAAWSRLVGRLSERRDGEDGAVREVEQLLGDASQDSARDC